MSKFVFTFKYNQSILNEKLFCLKKFYDVFVKNHVELKHDYQKQSTASEEIVLITFETNVLEVIQEFETLLSNSPLKNSFTVKQSFV